MNMRAQAEPDEEASVHKANSNTALKEVPALLAGSPRPTTNIQSCELMIIIGMHTNDTGDKHVGDDGAPAHVWSHDLPATGMELNDAHERLVAAVKPQRVATENVVVK